ncbi:hypothetical protein HPB47_028091 [Ixodes persulcatus]|uniref:Uncharacterized protein n=1 Tax=Ixodes persulcatus TaxID=34615 RepID=A0AC60PVF9_IXOPE|nr:hypothetical protein HPB47_028091 [Ixodes persulcatus]
MKNTKKASSTSSSSKFAAGVGRRMCSSGGRDEEVIGPRSSTNDVPASRRRHDSFKRRFSSHRCHHACQQTCPTDAGPSSLPEGNRYELFPPLSVSDIADMDAGDSASGKWHPVKSTRKRQKQGSSTSSSTVHLSGNGTTSRSTESLTVIFTSNKPDQIITTLGSLKISQALEKLCPECIIEVRVNDRLNLIAVDTRNGQTTRTLLNCTSICGLKVTAYEPSSRSAAVGVIRDVETNLSDAEITENIRSTVRITRLRRLGASESVKINFAAEVVAITEALVALSRYHPRNVVMITDSRCALRRLLMCTETTTSRARIALQHMEANGFVVQFQWPQKLIIGPPRSNPLTTLANIEQLFADTLRLCI